jgi:hypothetical protein|tara:strand:+ start:1653 stop:1931 length:279 start_codon:yes stop_codon:yes gene_type:complete
MATDRKAVGLCDICGFKYPHRILKMNSYGLMVCPTDFDGAFDLKNHPQNKAPNVKDDESIRNPRPPLNNDRNLLWEATTTEWEDTDQNWNMI